MKKFRCDFGIRTAGDAVTCAIVMAMMMVGLIGTRPANAQEPAASDGSDGAVSASMNTKVQVMDFRDVPVRMALEILLNVGSPTFSIDNRATGYVTCKGVDQPLVKALELLCSRAEVPLTLTKEWNVYFMRPSQPDDQVVAPKPRNPTIVTSPAPTSVVEVPRRVAGVLILEGGRAYAAIETGVPYAPTTQMTWVETGGARVVPSRVPSGVSGVPDLTLKSIDATGVTLTTEEGQTIRVPLAAAPAGK